MLVKIIRQKGMEIIVSMMAFQPEWSGLAKEASTPC